MRKNITDGFIRGAGSGLKNDAVVKGDVQMMEQGHDEEKEHHRARDLPSADQRPLQRMKDDQQTFDGEGDDDPRGERTSDVPSVLTENAKQTRTAIENIDPRSVEVIVIAKGVFQQIDQEKAQIG